MSSGVRIQLRSDTATNWSNENPVLLDGELGYESDTRKFKIGDGTSDWNSLSYTEVVSHNFGGSSHNADTLTNVNTKISDATLDDVSSTRDPNSHNNTAHSVAFLSDITAEPIGDLSDILDSTPAARHVLAYDDVDGRYENRLLVEADISDLSHYADGDVDTHLSGGTGIGYATGTISHDAATVHEAGGVLEITHNNLTLGAADHHTKYVLTDDLASGEITQLQNIDATTITSPQWGYVGSMSAQPLEDITGEQFTDLSDTPAYTGEAGNALVVNDTEDALVANAAIKEGGVNLIIGQPGSVISTGVVADVRIRYDCTITGVSMFATYPDGTNVSIQLDLWVDTLANHPPTDADTITGGNEPAISAGTTYEDTTLTGWSLNLTAGDIMRVYADTVDGAEQITLAIDVEK